MRVRSIMQRLAGIALTCLLQGPAPAHTRVPEPAEVWTGDTHAPVPKTLTGATVIDTPRLALLMKETTSGARSGPVVLDVSSEPLQPPGMAPGSPWMPVPHRALPGAVWLPGAGVGVLAPGYREFFEGEIKRATGGNVDAPLIVYCHRDCWLSWNAAKRAVDYGYRHVYWYAQGIEGWTTARYATVTVAARLPGAGATTGGTGKPPRLVVLDIELSGDLGGPELVAEHENRLKVESARLRDDLQRSGRFEVVDSTPAAGTIERLKSRQMYLHDCNGCDLDVGRELHAEQVMVAWVDRVSGLILTLTYETHDVATGQILARKSFDFRGDNDSAWNHAVDYLVRHLDP